MQTFCNYEKNNLSTNNENNCDPNYDDKSEVSSTDDKNSSNECVEWHNFTLKELLQISKQNKWKDVNKDITALIVSLSKYNGIKEYKDDDDDDDDSKQSMSGSEALNVISYLRNECECDICLECYIEPLTLSCGHSFCRLCIIQIQSKCDKKCPLCKSVTNGIDPYLHSQNVVINNCVKAIFSKQKYMQRMEQLNKEKENFKKNLPVFIFNMMMFPGMVLKLYLFEPRYLHMINRAISSGNRFAYLCKIVNNQNGDEYKPYNDDIACIIKIKDCQFLPDTRCVMQGIVEKRIKVRNNWIEKGTQGLWYVKYTDYKDVESESVYFVGGEQLELINKFINHIYNGSNEIIREIEDKCGSRIILNNQQTNIEKWSFWICSLIYIFIGQHVVDSSWIKKVFYTQNTLQRVQSCYDLLKSTKWNEKGKRFNISWYPLLVVILSLSSFFLVEVFL